MKRPLDRVFYYHASASPIGGHITHPIEKVIDHHASSTLPQAGGHASARIEKFNVHNMVRCEAAYSHTVGSVQKSSGNWTTLVTSVVEGVNIFDMVTVDRMVATIALEHPRDGYDPKVSFLGSQIENLRIGDRPIVANIGHETLLQQARPRSSDIDEEDPTTSYTPSTPSTFRPDGFPQHSWVNQPDFTSWAQQQSRNILKSDAPQEIRDRFDWVPDPQKRQQRGYVLCSLIDGVEGVAKGLHYGHVINVPDLGYLFLGELIVDQLSFKLSMMRVEFGCAVDGNLSLCDNSGGGTPMP